jgi:hypothetical protein
MSSRAVTSYFRASLALSVAMIAWVTVLFWMQNFFVLLPMLGSPLVAANGLAASILRARAQPPSVLARVSVVGHGLGVALAAIACVAALGAQIRF